MAFEGESDRTLLYRIANIVSIGYYTPLLGVGATYTIPVAIYRITT